MAYKTKQAKGKLMVHNPYSNWEAKEWIESWLEDTEPQKKFVKISGTTEKVILEKID